MAPRGVATALLNRCEIVLSPAEMIAQHGSSPNWLRALLGKTITTTANVMTNARALRKTFQARVAHGPFISLTPTDVKVPASSGFADFELQQRSVLARCSGALVLPLPHAAPRLTPFP